MKTQTLIYYPNGDIAQRIDDFLYEPRDILIIKHTYFKIRKVRDEIDIENCLVRKIYLDKE